MDKTEVFISGAGIAGLTLALKLAQAGIKTTIADPVKPEVPDKVIMGTRTCAIMNTLLPLLDDIGVLNKVLRYSAPLKQLKIIDGAKTACFSAKEIGEERFSLNIPNSILKNSLLGIAKKQSNLTCCFGSALQNFVLSPSGVSLSLGNGKTIETKLIIGADGYFSTVREKAGIKITSHDYMQQAHTCRLSHSKPHGNISTEIYYEDGPFTLVPLSGNTSSLVWLERDENAGKTLKFSREKFVKTLQEKSQNILGTLELLDGPQSFPIRAMIAKKLYDERLILIAEAAHALSPVGAQGLNTSLRDIQVLSNLIIETHRLGLDIGSFLLGENYQKQRQHDIKTRYAGVDGLNRVIATKHPLLKSVRGSALSIINDNEVLRKMALKTGFGK